MTNTDIVFTPDTQRKIAARGSAKNYECRIAEDFPNTVAQKLVSFIAEFETENARLKSQISHLTRMSSGPA